MQETNAIFEILVQFLQKTTEQARKGNIQVGFVKAWSRAVYSQFVKLYGESGEISKA